MGSFTGFQKTGFNSTSNNTEFRTGFTVALGRSRSTPASVTRIYNYCNRNSPNANYSFNCTFHSTPTLKKVGPKFTFKIKILNI